MGQTRQCDRLQTRANLFLSSTLPSSQTALAQVGFVLQRRKLHDMQRKHIRWQSKRKTESSWLWRKKWFCVEFYALKQRWRHTSKVCYCIWQCQSWRNSCPTTGHIFTQKQLGKPFLHETEIWDKPDEKQQSESLRQILSHRYELSILQKCILFSWKLINNVSFPVG